MARLVSYKTRDENRYSTFGGETSYNSSENLTESNRIRLLPNSNKKSKAKTKKMAKNTNKMPETMPTISASIEMHRNKIAQSRTINASSGSSGITQGRRRGLPLHQQRHSFGAQSRFNCCFNSKFCTRKCNWRCNQSDGCCTIANCWRTIFCYCWWKWCCRRKCCARICCGCIDYEDNENDDDDDDDIDAKFEQYKHEMRLNELKRECCDTVNDEQETRFQSNSNRIEALPSNTTNIDHKTSMAHDGESINDGTANGKTSSSSSSSKNTSKIFRYRKYWNWNDSLRSNSDKFLETLEYDMTDGEQSLQRTNNKYNPTDVSARLKGYWICTSNFFCVSSFASDDVQ